MIMITSSSTARDTTESPTEDILDRELRRLMVLIDISRLFLPIVLPIVPLQKEVLAFESGSWIF